MADKEVVQEPQFTKEQFLQSEQFDAVDRDVLSVILDEGQLYSLSEAKAALTKFKRKQVE